VKNKRDSVKGHEPGPPGPHGGKKLDGFKGLVNPFGKKKKAHEAEPSGKLPESKSKVDNKDLKVKKCKDIQSNHERSGVCGLGHLHQVTGPARKRGRREDSRNVKRTFINS